MTSRLTESLRELELLFARYTALSEAGSRACVAGDEAALGAALDARDLVAARVVTLIQVVQGARHAAVSAAARAAVDLAARPAHAAALAAQVASAELERRAHDARTVLGEQLDRLRHDDAARSAYAATVGRGESSRLDFTR